MDTTLTYLDMSMSSEWDMSANGTTPEPTPQGPQTAVPREVLSLLLTITIAIVMIGIGCGVDLIKVKNHLKRPAGIIVGFISQFLFMPVIAFVLAKIAQMDDVLTLALLLVGSCPGGTTSNIVTFWLDGDMDLSVSMTAVSSILGLGMMPLLLWIYSFGFTGNLQVPFQTIGITVAALVAPIALGILIRWKLPNLAPKLLKGLSAIGLLAIIAVAVLAIVTYNGSFQLVVGQIICAIIFPGIGMCLGYALSSLVSLYKPTYLYHYQRRTIAIETGIQNAQLAATIIQLSGFSLVDTGRIVLFPVIYLVSQLVWVALMLLVYRIYICKHPQQVEPRNEEISFDDDKEKGALQLKAGNENKAFTSSDLPKYEEAIVNSTTKSTAM